MLYLSCSIFLAVLNHLKTQTVKNMSDEFSADCADTESNKTSSINLRREILKIVQYVSHEYIKITLL